MYVNKVWFIHSVTKTFTRTKNETQGRGCCTVQSGWKTEDCSREISKGLLTQFDFEFSMWLSNGDKIPNIYSESNQKLITIKNRQNPTISFVMTFLARATKPVFWLGLFLKYGTISQYDFKALTRSYVSWPNVFSRKPLHSQQKHSRPTLCTRELKSSREIMNVVIWWDLAFSFTKSFALCRKNVNVRSMRWRSVLLEWSMREHRRWRSEVQPLLDSLMN